ncbi:MAG: TRAP-type transport system periplasmic protein, partial [Epulopiscium sp.]|nr:TRAP-type transport system periplasmic protein [Candidatus Epulonipiscium sp.]
ATPAPAKQGEAKSTTAKVIKVGNGFAEKHPAVIALKEKFKPLVEQKTNGRYTVEVYHSNQLGDDVKATEALRAGTLEMCTTSTAPLVGFTKELAIFDIPFLFPDEKVADAVLDGPIGKKLSDLMPSKGLINLAWWENGFRHLTNSVREVKTPADLKGLKIRTMENNFHLAAWRAMGANPSPMSWSEVFTALQQKAMDGQENPVPNFYTARIHEVNKYITTTGHIYSPVMLLFSKKIFDTLPKEDQDIFIAAAKEAGLYDRQLNREATKKYLEEIKKEGGIVTELTAEQKKPFQELTAPIWDQVAEKVGKDLVNELKAEIAKVAK